MILRKKIRSTVSVLVDTGAPTDGTSGTGAGYAGPGSLYVRTSTPGLYVNRGTKASPIWEPATKTLSLVLAGRNGAGAITATGAKVGDKVITAFNHTDGTNDAAKFEAVVTVADQIQQSDAGNLSAKTLLFQFAR